MLKNLESNFILRRLHSLSGILPLGLFTMFHIFANSTALFSAENYNTIIGFLRSIPFVDAVEWGAIYIPLIFHAGYGVIITSTAQKKYFTRVDNVENIRFVFQRLTGGIALLYLVYHILQFRLVHDLDYNYIAKSIASAQMVLPIDAISFLNPLPISPYWFYVIGLVAIVYHLANGLWGFCITWGITVGKKSQMAVTLLGIGIFVVFSTIGVMTINHLAEAGKALL